jgi:hypothetical protein
MLLPLLSLLLLLLPLWLSSRRDLLLLLFLFLPLALASEIGRDFNPGIPSPKIKPGFSPRDSLFG